MSSTIIRQRLRRFRTSLLAASLTLVVVGCAGGEEDLTANSEETGDSTTEEPDEADAGTDEEPDDSGGPEASAGADGDAPSDFPENEIRWVIPSSSGGGLDTTARQFAPFWEEELGVPITVDNQPGGNFIIGSNSALQDAPDCHTVLFHIDPILFFNYLYLDADFSYDDFATLGRLTIEPSVIRVPDDAPWETLEDFIEDARSRPGELSAGVGGLASNQVVGLVQLEQATGADFNLVPYDGGGDARTAFAAGEVDFVMAGVFNSLGVADMSKVVGVVQEENNWPELTDDAPTVREALDLPDLPENAAHYALFTNAGCQEESPEHYQYLVETFEAAANSDGFREALAETDEEGKLAFVPAEEWDAHMQEAEQSVQQIVEEVEEYQE